MPHQERTTNSFVATASVDRRGKIIQMWFFIEILFLNRSALQTAPSSISLLPWQTNAELHFWATLPFDGTPSHAKSQDSRVRYLYLWNLHFRSEKFDGTFSCSMFKPSLAPICYFSPFLLLPLPSVLSFVIVMARQEIEVQENRKKKRGWRFCQSEVGVRQTCQSHWGRRTQYNHGNVFALCCFRFTQIFISSRKFSKKVVIGDAEFWLD